VPELPEVETVRAGLDRWVSGRTIAAVEVTHARSVRRHVGGAQDLAARLVGGRITAVCRRGKYLWLPLAGPLHADSCLVAHLGMSGQLLIEAPTAPDEKHLHVRIGFADDGPELRFVDQRTFGGVLVDELVPTRDRPDQSVPASVAHIARDPLDPFFDDDAFVRALRRRSSAVKRALLDQTLVSGIGNIYADESLWRARLSGERRCAGLSKRLIVDLLGHVRGVLGAALDAGGTSFDALYVNVNGASGYFDRSLAVYGREGQPCRRCGTAVRRAVFMNRSSFYCPTCQRPPRRTEARTPHAQRSLYGSKLTVRDRSETIG
jgi:formamidopyrimidine-DNA glycosylase